VLLWVIPTWQDWADFEKAHERETATGESRTREGSIVERIERILLIDAPLSPLRTGRQPSRDDRTDLVEWT
jgi:hypothetical protein